jgi:hypothetical protein
LNQNPYSTTNPVVSTPPPSKLIVRKVKMTTPIPTLQTAAVIQEPGPNGTVRIDNAYPVETPGENQVLVKLAYSGVW